MTGGLQARIIERLSEGAATAAELGATLGATPANIRNTLAGMYFSDGVVGCDSRGRYHLASTSSNGVSVVRHVGGKDVVV